MGAMPVSRAQRLIISAVSVLAMTAWMIAIGAIIVLAVGAVAQVQAAEPPRAALQYQRDLTREARAGFGMNAPVPVMAAQIHQESSWRPDAESPYAQGLTQFTPDTAEWIAEIYPQLGAADVWSPQWAIRAMVRYDRHIHDRQATPAATPCDRWAFTLSGYNGGPGWVNRDRAECKRAAGGRSPACGGCDPSRWFGHVADHPDDRRADWAVKENRGYPDRILRTLQPRYRHWGPEVTCPAR